MENKHTPGPWAAESVLSDGYLGLRVVAEEDDREVARVPIMEHASTPDFDRDGIEEAPIRFPRQKTHTYTTELEADTIRANAALIAAAPELLYAAIAALDCLERPHAERDENRVRVMLDVAVAKADGRA